MIRWLRDQELRKWSLWRLGEGHLGGSQDPKGMPGNIAKVANRKLAMINAAAMLLDLAVPPGNRLEALKGDLQGKHSIRINEQFRLVFRWTDAGPEEVELLDYH